MADQTVEEYTRALEAEWGTYVATKPITINGARAFNVGDAIPVSHVTRGIVTSDQYETRTTPAGQAATVTK